MKSLELYAACRGTSSYGTVSQAILKLFHSLIERDSLSSNKLTVMIGFILFKFE